MRMRDINGKFTELVAEYVGKGYTINLGTMRGSQGEVGKVDLIKGDHFVRIYVDSMEDYSTSVRYIVIYIGEIRQFSKSLEDTIWYKELTTIYETRYYRLGNDWYTESLYDALKARDLYYSRLHNKSRIAWYWDENKDITSPKTVEIAVKYLKRVAKYQRVSRDDIVVKHYSDSDGESRYYILYKNHTFRLK